MLGGSLGSIAPMRIRESHDAERIGRKGRDMPFIYDESEIEWTDDENDPPAPKRSQFKYISPPMFGGAERARPVFHTCAQILHDATFRF